MLRFVYQRVFFDQSHRKRDILCIQNVFFKCVMFCVRNVLKGLRHINGSPPSSSIAFSVSCLTLRLCISSTRIMTSIIHFSSISYRQTMMKKDRKKHRLPFNPFVRLGGGRPFVAGMFNEKLTDTITAPCVHRVIFCFTIRLVFEPLHTIISLSLDAAAAHSQM